MRRVEAMPGDLGSRFQVNDEDPSANIPSEDDRNRYPLEFGYFLQDLVARAQVAFHDKDWATSVKYYEALAKTTPERSIAFSKLCVAYDMIGKADFAIENCRQAMAKDGARVMDHTRFLKLALNREQLDAASIDEVEASLRHLREHLQSRETVVGDESARAVEEVDSEQGTAKAPLPLPLKVEIELYDCKLAAVIKDSARLERCIASLHAEQAEPRVVLGFEWARAAALGDEDLLAKVLERGKTLGLSAQALEKMRAAYETEVSRSALAEVSQEAEPKPVQQRPPLAPSSSIEASDDASQLVTTTATSGSDHRGAWLSALLGSLALGVGLVVFWKRRKTANPARA